jgi:hypothetical protein
LPLWLVSELQAFLVEDPSLIHAAAAVTTGASAQLYGSGGNGGIAWNAGAAAAGGAGSAGIVIITEYTNQ